MELPYRRSVGPVVGAFLTGCATDGSSAAEPPPGGSSSPRSSTTPTPATLDEIVDVADAGTVKQWAWVEEPLRNHPLDRPFAWALVQLDGADTSMLHALDAGSAQERRGRHAGAGPLARRAARPHHRHRVLRAGAMSERSETTIENEPNGRSSSCSRSSRSTTSCGRSPIERRLRPTASSDGKIVGPQVPVVRAGLRAAPGFCPICVVETTEADEVEISDKGIVTSWTVLTPIQYHGQTEREDYALASILLDGADGTIGQQRLVDVALDQIRMGMRVEAVWADESERERRRRRRGLRLRQRHHRVPRRPASPTPTAPSLREAHRCERRRHRLVRPVGGRPTSRRPRRRCSIPVVTEAIERSGIPRKEIGFTCSGSADYLAGAPFAFVGNLEATGAWPPISESHVEMDGAWALYEAWVRLQHGDVDVALVFSLGHLLAREPARGAVPAERPLLPDAAVGRPRVARGAAGAGLPRRATGARRPTWPRWSAAAGAGPPATRTPSCPAIRAPTSCSRALRGVPAPRQRLPAGHRRRGGGGPRRRRPGPRGLRAAGVDPGIDHRADPHYPGVRDLADRGVGAARGPAWPASATAPVEVAELPPLQPRGADPARGAAAWATRSRSTRRAVRWLPTR